MSILNSNAINTEEQHDYEDPIKYTKTFQISAEQSSPPTVNCVAYNIPATTLGPHYIDGKEAQEEEQLHEHHL